MERIQSKLKMTLAMVDDNAGAQAGLDMYLELLGHIHAGLHINSDQFSAWRDADSVSDRLRRVGIARAGR